jgi:hypothetical protein
MFKTKKWEKPKTYLMLSGGLLLEMTEL